MMGVSAVEETVVLGTPGVPLLPQHFLNCYEIVNASSLKWPMTAYAVDSRDGSPQGHDQRGSIKDIVWNLVRGQCKRVCRGPGFVVDVSPRLVVLPSDWQLPVPISVDGYNISLERSFVATPGDASSRVAVEGVIREGIKKHFKNEQSDELVSALGKSDPVVLG